MLASRARGSQQPFQPFQRCFNPYRDSATDAPPSDNDGDGLGNSVLRRRQAAVDDQQAAASGHVVDVEQGEDVDGEPRAPPQPPATIPVILWTSELTAANVVDKYLDKDRYDTTPAGSHSPKSRITRTCCPFDSGSKYHRKPGRPLIFNRSFEN